MIPEWRTIESVPVIDLIAEAHAEYERFHDLYDGMTWRLCRDPVPMMARQIAPETYVIKSDSHEYPGFCIITLVYSLDTAQNIIWVEDLIVDPI